MNIELTKDEANVLVTILGTMIAGDDEGPRGLTTSIFRKLESAGASWGFMGWHVNEFNNIELDYFEDFS